MPTWPTDSISSGFVYVRETEPENPEEGETWYDLNANEAKVYDGGVWHLLTVTEHSEIGGVSAGQHRSDSNIQSVVDGAVDADTVDGQHASQLGGAISTYRFQNQAEVASGESYDNTFQVPDGVVPTWFDYINNESDGSSTIEMNFSDGTTWSVPPNDSGGIEVDTSGTLDSIRMYVYDPDYSSANGASITLHVNGVQHS